MLSSWTKVSWDPRETRHVFRPRSVVTPMRQVTFLDQGQLGPPLRHVTFLDQGQLGPPVRYATFIKVFVMFLDQVSWDPIENCHVFGPGQLGPPVRHVTFLDQGQLGPL